jgi:1-deoxy-D-xylulose-5-phosphate synthase
MENVFDDGMDSARTRSERRGSAREERVTDATRPKERPVRLDEIDDPADLRRLSEAQLKQLAPQIREFLVEVAAKKGGHFAASMGVVELTLALHYVFDTPKDQLVWDVGHQAYVHKLLTGRRDRLPTIRQKGGLSGFLKRSESPYDTFGAGHASTSTSAALGMAAARDLLDGDQAVVAVIGDGAMTGGLAFEALNNAGALGSRLLVVLNDNAMSISPNVGALAHYLTSITTNPVYQRMHGDMHALLERLPRFGQVAGEFAKRLEQGIKSALVPGMLFQAFGFAYYGPVDGHDMDELVDVLQRIRGTTSRGPVLLHVLTQKGKGYAPAEADPCKWHGVKPFDPLTGGKPEPAKAEQAKATSIATEPPPPPAPSYTNVFAEALIDVAERRRDVVGITAAMATGTGIDAFEKAFPDRTYDVGIAEGHGVTFAAGLTTQGIRPVCAIYSTFLQRAFDHMIHDVALQSLPVVFALDRAGLVGADGPTHHGTFDLSYLRMVPGMIVSAPKDADELADLLETGLDQSEHPFAVRYPRGNAPGPRTRAARTIPIGSWEVLEEADGEHPDVTLLAVGAMIPLARDVAATLREQGLAPRVVNARFVKPLDLDELRRAQGSRLVVTLEEGSLAGGFGSAVHEASARHGLGLSGKLHHEGIPDAFVSHGTREQLFAEIGLEAEPMAARILEKL